MESPPPVFGRMHDEVRGSLDELTSSIIGSLREQIAVYGRLSAAELVDGVAGDIARAIDAVAAGRAASDEELEGCEEVGRERALQGIPVEALIRAFQIASEETLAFALAAGERLGATPQELLDFSRTGWAWANMAMTRAALAHRDAELELARHDVRQRDELLRRLVLDASAGAELALRIPVYGLNPATEYYVARVRALCGERTPALVAGLVRRVGHAGTLAGIVHGDAVVVSARPTAIPPDCCAGVAGPGPLLELHGHFSDASRALETAWSFVLPGAHRLEQLGLLPGVIADRRLGELLDERVIARLGSAQDQARFCETFEALFGHDMSVPAAAKALFVHENTVRKRVRLAEERTGLSLRRVDDLVATWWALRYRAARTTADRP
jgi:PucR C-terminal helix-turn-helix domain